MAHRENVPTHAFEGNCPQMAPIRLGGIPLSDLAQRRLHLIPGANDQVFENAPYRFIKLCLSWPGYPPHDPISVDLYAGVNPPTRASVAFQVASHFCKYLEGCEKMQVHPTAAKWRIGKNGLAIYNIICNRLVNTYENVWQMDCETIV
ncbi:hypothetical protein SCHPADRAFT_894783 [Schizopora paradoxa]|uniref:Uncharacterized protein n=1 Tax=Schizopora paradoxa TaxID=27342 RepID=A0A0H2R7F0_9AGAM|nr:hypothetical protein SCHPADRAFT_894783 [Schizopora paradoxa]